MFLFIPRYDELQELPDRSMMKAEEEAFNLKNEGMEQKREMSRARESEL